MARRLERIPLDRIRAEAREIRVGRAIQLLIAAFFFAIGWIAVKTWQSAIWAFAAIKVGWQEGRTLNREPER